MEFGLDELLYPLHHRYHILELRYVCCFVDLLHVDDFSTLITDGFEYVVEDVCETLHHEGQFLFFFNVDFLHALREDECQYFPIN